MKFHKDSWISKLNREYKKVSVEKIDEANKIVTKALSKLEDLNRRK